MTKLCSIPDCGKKHLANGYCAKHNARFKKYGDPCAPTKSKWDGHIPVVKKCSNPDCQNFIQKGTYCAKCRQRKSRHGDVNIVKPKGNKEIWKLAKGGGSKPKYAFSSSILNGWSPALAWLLGWTITDGCVEKKTRWIVSWMLKDRQPLEIIQKLFKTNKPIEEAYKTNKKTGEKRKYYRLRLCGKQVAQKFIELGIEPNKTFITKVPSVPKEFMWHFLRGVMEGDGHIYQRSSYREDYIRIVVGIASGNPEFLEEIKKIIGMGDVRFVDKPGHSFHSLDLDCSKAVSFLKQTYQNSEGLRLTRKYEKWQKFIELGQKYKS